ncbi:hypothetical protein [Zobellella sp. DQSA1]|uniref:hypothetical protein n=1 Tax=Zobellella sp. DQSA1 TaxID=3342386 RepID=UPI0035BEE643
MASNPARIMAYAQERKQFSLLGMHQDLGIPRTSCSSAVAQLVHSGKLMALGDGVYRVVDRERHRELVRMVIFGKRGTVA